MKQKRQVKCSGCGDVFDGRVALHKHKMKGSCSTQKEEQTGLNTLKIPCVIGGNECFIAIQFNVASAVLTKEGAK